MAALPSLAGVFHPTTTSTVPFGRGAFGGIRNCSFSSSCVSAKVSDEQPSQKHSSRRIWRRRKLTKKDDMLTYKLDRIPFLEEQVRKIRETGKLMTLDIDRLMLREENRFDFVNEVAHEAKMYVERNRDEYGGSKKAIFHVLSNRMNEAGFYRPEAYMETDPFKPGPTYLKEEL
ncbi:PLASTID TRANSCRIPTIONALLY ACTIVE 7 protein [Nymphaea thermarum]|nr:PLASTID TRANSCRIPTIONALLY ACTIVE 7 protein [Nymphaea thermarum]